jgi:PAS domain S-box-containing protein
MGDMNVTIGAAGHASVEAMHDGGLNAPDLLQRIVEEAPVAIVVVQGPEDRIALANASFRAMVAAKRTVLGRQIAEVLPVPVRRATLPLLDEVRRTERPIRLREFATSADGTEPSRFWDAMLTPLRGDGRTAEDAIAIMVSDVTARVVARKKAEQLASEAVRRAHEAEHAQRMLDALMAYIPQGIAIADAPDMRVRRVSYQGLAMTKRPWQELLDEIPPERIPERWQVYHLDGKTLAGPDEFALSRAARRGEIVTNERWLLRQHDGRLVPVLCNAGPIRNSRGEVTGAVLSWLNISSLEESRERLMDTAKRFELAIEAGKLGTWDYDLTTGQLVWSDRCKAIFGLPPEAEVTYERYLQMLHPNDSRRVHDAMLRALDPDGEGEFDVECRVMLPEGGERWIVARGRAYFGETSQRRRAERVIGTVRDISERVHAMAERESLLEQKDTLLREVNHRVTNSLQLISSLLRLQSVSQPPDVRRLLEETRARVQTVAQVHARLSQTSQFATVEVGTYLRELCADLARSLGQACDTRLRLAVEATPVRTDVAVSLGLIVNELVTNAFKYAYGAGSTGAVHVRFERCGDVYRLVVRDEGRGLPPDFKMDDSAGLGMRIVASLVERLGAVLEIEAQRPGAGFNIAIPISEMVSRTGSLPAASP